MPIPSPARPSLRSHRFDEVPAPRIQRSVFDGLSHKNKVTFDSGYLVPLTLMEVLPGDTFNVQAQFFGRLQTLDFPVLDNIFFDTFWFYCPMRLLWTNWHKFLGAQDTPGASIDFSIPVVSWQGDPADIGVHSLGDFLGLPILEDMSSIDYISALPMRMYNRIYDEWFRAQELEASISGSLGDGPDTLDYSTASGAYAGVMRRGKRHNYITSCLLAPQRGNAVELPLGDRAPVLGDGTTIGLGDGADTYGMAFEQITGPIEQIMAVRKGLYGDPRGTATGAEDGSGAKSLGLDGDPTKTGMYADLTNAIAATIGDMREAIAIQQMLERDARFGTRYVERIFAQFGVVVPDFTAQRVEYLGGSIDRVGVMQVPQMTASPGSPTMADAKGALAAYAQIQASSGFNKSFVEHGYIMCIGNLRADLTFQQRIDKLWTRETRYDFYDPAMAHLGEQPVLDREVWFDTAGTPTGVFGYQERWAEYRMMLDGVRGKFRSDATGSLDSWHLALDFTSQPDLNATFIRDNPPLSRILAVTSEPQCLMDMAFKVRAARPMPVYSVPGLERL